jgi:hypothetical protein
VLAPYKFLQAILIFESKAGASQIDPHSLFYQEKLAWSKKSFITLAPERAQWVTWSSQAPRKEKNDGF